MLGVAGHRNAPVESGTRYRKILQTAFDEAYDLVHAGLRQDEIRMIPVEIEQLVLIGGESEEITLLLHPFDRRAGWAAPLAVGSSNRDLGLAVVRLVADRVPAGVFGKIDVAVVRHPLPDRLRSAIMPRLGRADEIVVAALEPFDHGAEPRHGAIGEFARGNPLAR